MFRLTRPTPAAIQSAIEEADSLPPRLSRFLTLNLRDSPKSLPFGFVHDQRRTMLGRGAESFAAARQAFERWAMFDLGWVRVANPRATIEPNQIVAVEVWTLGLWSVNVSRIVDVIRSENAFGFVYATTSVHVEEGEERFLLEFDAANESVWYRLEAVSRPRALPARIGYPIARHFQHRFARESHARMLEEVRAAQRSGKLIP